MKRNQKGRLAEAKEVFGELMDWNEEAERITPRRRSFGLAIPQY